MLGAVPGLCGGIIPIVIPIIGISVELQRPLSALPGLGVQFGSSVEHSRSRLGDGSRRLVGGLFVDDGPAGAAGPGPA